MSSRKFEQRKIFWPHKRSTMAREHYMARKLIMAVPVRGEMSIPCIVVGVAASSNCVSWRESIHSI